MKNNKYNKKINYIVSLYKEGMLNEEEMKTLISFSLGEYVNYQVNNELDKIYNKLCKSFLA